MSKIIQYEAAGGVVVDGSQMLLLDRPERGEVRLPKGHVEAGESAASAALRETTEETGYDHLLIVADLGEQVVEFDYQGNHIIRREHFFLMRPVSHRQSLRTAVDEAQFRVRWTPLAEAVGLLSFAAEQEMARRALRALAE